MAPEDVVIDVTTANVDFVRGGDGRYVRHLCETADVLLLQEAKNITVANLLPKGWVSLQVTTSAATKGSCIAFDGDVFECVHRKLVPGAWPSIGGRRVGMLVRYFQVAILRHRESGRLVRVISAHLPPMRFRALQPGYTKRLAAWTRRPSVVVGADANMAFPRFAAQLGLRTRNDGIVGIATNLEVCAQTSRNWGERQRLTDHPAVAAKLALRPA